MSVGNVGSKFANKETVFSSPFSCQRDPRPKSFKMLLGFGNIKGKETWLSANVIHHYSDVTLRKLKFTLYDTQGKIVKSMQSGSLNATIPKGQPFGWPEFFNVTNPGDVVWRCTCEVEYEGLLPAAPIIPTPNGGMGNDYLKLLESADNSDVTFSVQGVQIKAHKTVLLARSSYFASMFSSDMKESASGEIDVPDADPTAFRGMLEYLYGGSSPKGLNDIAMDLFSLADKYGLKDLQQICESHILANLNADNVVDTLLLAEQHDREELMSQAEVVLKANLEVVQQSKESREKLEQRPSFLFDLFVQLAI